MELLVALTICILFVALRRQGVGALTLVMMTIRGQACYCSLLSGLNSYAYADDLNLRAKENLKAARLIERDPAGFDLYETGSQRVWIPTGSLTDISLNIAEQERGIYDYRGLGAKPGDVVVDAGANVGLYALCALRQGVSKVIAIEPVAANVECLRRNLADEVAAGRVIICAKGLWDRDDFLEMHLDPRNATAHSFVIGSRERKSTRLPVTTLDRLVKELDLKWIDFIKMDIEGAEQRALIGARDSIRTFRPRMAISAYHLADDPVAIPALVKAARTDYQQAGGPCMWLGPVIYPHVLFYF